MTKIEKVLKYANAQLSRLSPYVWGGQGQLLRKLTVEKLCLMESPDEAARVTKFIAKNIKRADKRSKIYDCSGFVIMCYSYAGVKPFSNPTFDDTANGLMGRFSPISPAARKAGDLVFKVDKNGKAYHVGLLLDPDNVCECKGRDYGVVKTSYNSDWSQIRRVIL